MEKSRFYNDWGLMYSCSENKEKANLLYVSLNPDKYMVEVLNQKTGEWQTWSWKDDGTFYGYNIYRITEKKKLTPEQIAPKLWNTYKDIMDKEDLEELAKVILDTENHKEINFKDDTALDFAFIWLYTQKGWQYWKYLDSKYIAAVSNKCEKHLSGLNIPWEFIDKEFKYAVLSPRGNIWISNKKPIFEVGVRNDTEGRWNINGTMASIPYYFQCNPNNVDWKASLTVRPE